MSPAAIKSQDQHTTEELHVRLFRLVPGVLLSALLLACGSPDRQSAQSPGGDTLHNPAGDTLPLFEDAELYQLEWEPQSEAEVRGRPVRINPEIYDSGALSEGNALLFHLFDGEEYTGRIARMNRGYANTISITGRIPGEENYFTLSTDSTQVLANIHLTQPRRHYQIHYANEIKSHVLVERDPAKEDVLPEHPPLTPPDTADTADTTDTTSFNDQP